MGYIEPSADRKGLMQDALDLAGTFEGVEKLGPIHRRAGQSSSLSDSWRKQAWRTSRQKQPYGSQP